MRLRLRWFLVAVTIAALLLCLVRPAYLAYKDTGEYKYSVFREQLTHADSIGIFYGNWIVEFTDEDRIRHLSTQSFWPKTLDWQICEGAATRAYSDELIVLRVNAPNESPNFMVMTEGCPSLKHIYSTTQCIDLRDELIRQVESAVACGTATPLDGPKQIYEFFGHEPPPNLAVEPSE